MNANRHSMQRVTGASRRACNGQPTRRLRYRHLAFGVGLALGSLLVCGMASAASGAAAVAATETPTGGRVVGGQGSIAQKGAETVVNQQSRLLALDWQTFNVGKDASVLFNQPGASAIALNRILDQNPSQIFGKVTSNGQIFLINTHGIIFGASAQLNVGGLVASTLDLTPDDFLKQHFSLDAHGARAGIVNHGTIAAASGGSVSLIGGQVANDGLILADYGHINLDGADKAVLDFDGNGLINVEITGALKQRFDADKAAVTNTGKLSAKGGTVVLQASAAKDLFTNLVNNSGVIKAGGISTAGGVVRLVAHGGNTVNSGSIDVSGTHGGSVQLLSDRDVMVTGGALDASGTHGGGSIRVGGGWQGGEGLAVAARTYIAPDASLNADATIQGDGGSIAVFSRDNSVIAGSLSARGGTHGGDGGLVETSSLGALTVAGTPQVTARSVGGLGGNWLIDPNNLTIVSGNGNTNINNSNPFETTDDGASLGVDLITAALTGGANVTVKTGSNGANSEAGNITLNADLDYDGTGTNSLTFDAANKININNKIFDSTAGGDTLNLSLLAGGSVTLDGEISLGGGNFLLAAGVNTAVNAALKGGDVSITSDNGINLAADVDASGALKLASHNAPILQNGGAITVGGDSTIDALHGAIMLANAGNDFQGTVDLTGGITQITDQNALTLGALAIGDLTVTSTGALDLGHGAVVGALNVTSNGGSISQAGALSVTGASTFDAGTGDIALANAGNSFGDAISIAAAGTVELNGSGTLTMGAVANTGSLVLDTASMLTDDITTSGDQTYHGAVWLDGSGNGNGVTLTTANSTVTFDSTVDNASGLGTAQALTVDVGTGATGTASFGGAVGGGANGPLGALTLDGTGTSAFYATVQASSLTAHTQTRLYGNVTTTGVQDYGNMLYLFNPVTLVSNGGAITFADVSNQYPAQATLTVDAGSGTVAFNGAVCASGCGAGLGLDVTANGGISEGGSGEIHASGASSFTAGTADITLDNSANDFQGPLSLAGGTTKVTTAGALELDAVNVGSLQATAGGAITQTASSSLTVGGASTFDAGTNAITLANSGNDFGGLIDVASGGAVEFGGTGTLDIGTVTSTASLTLDNAATLHDDITTSGDQTYHGAVWLDGSGNGNGVTLTTANSTVTFDSTVDNASGLGTAQALTVDVGTGATGTASFGGAVGGGANGPLGALTLDGTGTSAFYATVQASSLTAHTQTRLYGNVTTTGVQDYGNMLYLFNPVTLVSNGGAITFADVSNQYPAQATLTVDAGSGTVAFNGAVCASGCGAGLGLDVTANGGISEGGSGEIHASGASSFTAGTADITLDNSANDFQGPLSLAGGTTKVTTAGALELDAVNVGSLQATAGGAITQTASSSLTVGGASTFDAGTNAITLANAGNDFTGAVSLTGGNTQIADGNALTLGTLATGDLIVTSHGALNLGEGAVDALSATSNGGSITQAGGLTVTGAAALNAGLGAIALTDTGNDFQDSVSAIGAGIAIYDTNDLSIASLTDNANGDVSLIAGGQLSGVGAIYAGAGDITLAANGGALSVSGLAGHDISVIGRDGVTLTGVVDAGGTLQLGSTNAAIVQIGAAITAVGDTTVDAGGGAITLANAGNDFTGAVSLTGGNTQIADGNALTLGTLATGNLIVTSHGALNLGAGAVGALSATSNGGAITQTGGLTATGTSSIDAGANAITLDKANDFTGVVSLTNSGANDVTLDNGANLLSLGNVNVGSGALTVDATGITQVVGTGIVQSPGAGAASFNAHAGVLNLHSTLNNLTGIVNLANTGNFLVYLDNGGNALTLGALHVGSGPLTITDYGIGALLLTQDVTTDGGAVNFGGAVTIDGSPTVTVDTTGGGAPGANISFGGDVNGASANADSLTLNAGNGAVNFGGAVGNTAVLQNLTTTSRTFSVANTLGIGQDLSITSTAGPISQGAAWTVGGASMLDAGSNAITLTDAGNSFGGPITVTGSAVELAGTGTLDMGSVSAASLILDGASTLHDDITTSGTQTYNGAVTLDGSGSSVALSGNGITFASTVDNLSGATPQDLTVNSGTGAAKFAGAIGGINGPLGALSVTGTGQAQFLGDVAAASLDATAPVLLGADITTSGNQKYNGAVALGTNVAVTSNNGNVTFAGTLDNAVSGTPESLVVTAANGAVTFGNAVGSLNGPLGNLGSSSKTFSDSGAFGIGGNLTVTTTGGDITQGAAWKVTGNSVFGAGNNAVALGNPNNDFTGSVTLTGAGVAVTDVNDLTIGGLTDNNNGNVSLIAGGQLFGVGPINAGTGSITLTAAGAVLTTAALTGGDISLTGGNGISLGDDVNAGGTLTLSSGGNIDESSTTVITANTLTGASTGSTHLDGDNFIANLENFTANGFSLTNAQALTVASGITIDGMAGGTALETTAGDLTINGTVGNAAGTTSLTSAGDINEGAGGVVVAATLTGASAGDTTLTGSNNKIASVGQFNAVNFTLIDNTALSVVGQLATTGDISLTTTGGPANVLTVGQALSGGSVTLQSAGDLSITRTVQGSAVNLAANGNLSIDAAVDSGTGTTTLTQNGSGSISEGVGGSITAGTLTGTAQGGATLGGANAIANLGNFTAVGFSLTNATDLTVAAGSTVDGGANTSLTITGAGSDLTIDGHVNGTTTNLVSAGAINEGATGVVTADTLTGSATAAAQLTGNNAINKLGNFTAASLALSNGQTLTIGAGSTVDGGSSTTLTTTGATSNLVIDGSLKGSTTTLNVGGAISEGAAGALTAGTLTGTSGGAADLSGNNAVANLGDFTAAGFSLTSNQSLTVASGATVDGGFGTTLTTTGAGHDLGINGTVVGDLITLNSAGAIGEGSGGLVQGGALTGNSVGDTSLGQARVDELDAFSAADFSLTNAGALTVNGPLATIGNAGNIRLATTGAGNALTVNQAVQGAAISLASAGDLTVANAVTGTQVDLTADGNLAINAAVDSGSGTTTLTQTGSGAITGNANGSITAATLTGSATGTTTLGSAGQFMANHVDTLGGFSSQAGFSFTNDGTLTLASVNGSAFTVDAGKSDLYLEVRNGDLLQTGNNWLYDGSGTWSSTGRIGLSTAPIYVTGVGAQTVAHVGMPPAYFYGVDYNGNLLPFSPSTGGLVVNVPTSILSSKSQGVNGHSDHYIDISVVTAIYRAYGIVPTGVLLPRDQYDCRPDQPPSELCPERN